MDNQVIFGKSITFNNPTQVINMGGPWVGELFIDKQLVIDNVIIDNVYFNSDQHKLYFLRYHLISKWQKDNYFSIYCIDMQSSLMCMYDLKFEQIFIDKVASDYELTYFDAFHNKNNDKVRKINLNNFKCIPQ